MILPITLADQIAELKAELAIRTTAYAKWILAGRMKQVTADKKFAAMRGALHVLIEMQESLAKARELQAAAPGLEIITRHRERLCRDRQEEGLPAPR